MRKLINILCFLLPVLLSAQTNSACYKTIMDASGYEPSQYQKTEIEKAACKLIDSLPNDYKDKFKVMAFCSYLHTENIVGGFQTVYDLAKQEAKQESEFYILFTRQTTVDGIYSRFWIDINLPKEGIFSCMDKLSPHYRKNLTKKYEIMANEIYKKRGNNFYDYHIVEIAIMDSLSKFISELRTCCIANKNGQRNSSCSSCIYSESEFSSLLENEGLYKTSVTKIIQKNSFSSISGEIGYKIFYNNKLSEPKKINGTLKKD